MAKKSNNNTIKLLVMCTEIVLALVAVILLLATPAVTYTMSSGLLGSKTTYTVAGAAAIFGSKDPEYALTWAGLLSFIFVACALVILLVLCCLTLAKKKFALAGICKFVAAGLLIVAGVFVFFEVAAFKAANGDASFSWGSIANATYALGAGWLISGILSIVAGGLSCAEAFLKK